jgi:ATP adenylyltransferase
MKYLEEERVPGCIFCDKPEETRDPENYILYRGKHSFVMMNIYPYNTGHLLVIPYRHVEGLDQLPNAVLLELMHNTKRSLKVLRQAFSPGGFNVGLNLGKAAGAGIAEHLHFHLVPRWHGDTNFMPVLAETKVIPQDLAVTYETLHVLFHGRGDKKGKNI